MITVSLYGRLGNNLWQYAVCRTVAEKNGFDFHIPRNFPNYFQLNLGVESFKVDNYFPFENNHDAIQKYDSEIWNIKDFTKIDGYFQSEKYIVNNRDNIIKWFNLDKHLFKSPIDIDENTCVINFRGGDYTSIEDVFLVKKYWDDSIKKMRDINKNMKFIIITDDIHTASSFFTDIKIYHFDVVSDFMIVRNAPYLIIANSTFSWWGAWLNEIANLIIAPKYWFRYNISNGWWSPSDSITTRFHYMDRDGNLQNYNECLSEITDFNYLDHYK